MTAENIQEYTLSTGIIIAGAYADKIRKTLFAQLRDLTKNNRDMAREAARASAELNRLLYYLIVDELKSDKGDAVRVRIKYKVYPDRNYIEWDYDSLVVEYFKRLSDEEVGKSLRKVLNERLKEVQEAFGKKPPALQPPQIGEGAGAESFKGEEVKETPAQPAESAGFTIGGLSELGETSLGSMLLKIEEPGGESLGVVELRESEGRVVGEALVVYSGEGYRAFISLEGSIERALDNKNLVIEELRKARFTKISKEEAENFIREKMSMIS
jgi:hypothetical protein